MCISLNHSGRLSPPQIGKIWHFVYLFKNAFSNCFSNFAWRYLRVQPLCTRNLYLIESFWGGHVCYIMCHFTTTMPTIDTSQLIQIRGKRSIEVRSGLVHKLDSAFVVDKLPDNLFWAVQLCTKNVYLIESFWGVLRPPKLLKFDILSICSKTF